MDGFLSCGNIIKEMNNTDFSLTPKVQWSGKLDQYRPVSLYNMSYHIFLKFIANRLKPCRDKIIFPVQSAFLNGRQINDNIILEQEIVWKMKHKEDILGRVAIKLDIGKSFKKV